MPVLWHILRASAICLAMLLEPEAHVVQAFPTIVNDIAVRDGAKVTARFEITPRDNPTRIYSAITKFVQGQHIVPSAIEEQMAGMHPGELKTFPLSPEEGFGPYDESKIETIPPSDLSLDAREGDTVVEEGTGRTARIITILPEEAVLDLNHPLAGKPLIVTLQIVTIESSDAEAPIP